MFNKGCVGFVNEVNTYFRHLLYVIGLGLIYYYDDA